MPKNFKLFGVLNVVDLSVILILLITLFIGIFFPAGQLANVTQEEFQKQGVEIDVILRGEKVSRNGDIFKAGDKTFITIRNVPYTKLDIVKSERSPEMITIPDPKNPKKAIAVENPAFPNTYNFLVTVADKAVITDDGVIVGGNKIKIGLPITLEGYDYRLSGIVSDVRIKKTSRE